MTDLPSPEPPERLRSPGAGPPARPGIVLTRLRRQQRPEERIDHPPIWIHRLHPLTEVQPALAIGSFDMLAFDERALVEQGDSVALKGEFVEAPQEGVPGNVIGAGVNGVE